MIRKILYALLFIVLLLVVWYGPLIRYGIGQAMGQLHIVWNARPVEEFLADPSFPDSLKTKLKLIADVRRFAIDSLGLEDTKNYKTIFDQKGKEVMWVVTASEPFQLKAKEWDFPVLGSVPYKGYFDVEKARKEKEQLEKEGWDVRVQNPDGWSTLGWFTDPILSDMLTHSEGDLASLIIHEMVHATLFVKDSVTFNENFASFIGDTTAYDFLRWRFGASSKEFLTYWHEDQDYRHYSSFILKSTKALDSLYTVIEGQPVEVKRKRKEEFMQRIVDNMDTLSLYRSRKPSARFRKKLPNNAYFMTYRHYQSKQKNFKKELAGKYKGDIRAMIRDYRSRYPSV